MSGGTGFAAIPTYLRGHLNPYQIAVYAALMWRHGANGAIFPSHDRIAKDSGMSRRKVVTTLQSLRDMGLVTWEAVQRPNGAATSNRYAIHLRPPVHEVHTPSAGGAHEVDTGDLDALREGQNSVPTAKQTSSGPRDRRTNVFDAEGLTAELEDDQEANGFLAGHNWCGSTEELIETALAEVKAKGAINEGAWLAKALANHKTPVGKADHLMQLVGDGDD